LRKRAGLSQEKLAERANLHPTYLSDIERGVENVSLDVLMRLAGALRSSIHDLVEGI
jgi:XRE family transcriptional regulator, regulator of sulfur utilization